MIVIIDTNVFTKKFTFEDVSIRILLEFSNKGGFSIVVPEVVCLETINQVREQIEHVAKANNERIQKLIKETDSYLAPYISQDKIESEVNKYEKFFREKLSFAGVEVYPIPNVSHEQLLDRDLHRRKPFGRKGKGYRDALIWETVQCIAQSKSDNIALITSNTNDFSDDETKILHSDLKNDLKAKNLSDNKVIIYPSLVTFIKDILIPKLPLPDQTFTKFLHENHPELDFDDELCISLTENLSSYEIENSILNKPDTYESISISQVEKIENIEIHNENILSIDERILEISATIDCEFDTFIYKGDLSWMREDDMPYIWDHDWNKYYVAASFSDSIQVDLFITLDTKEGKITAVELIEMK